jgi:hypothetical protein
MWLACWRLCRQKRRSRPTAPTAMWLACWRLCRPMCGKAVPFQGQVLSVLRALPARVGAAQLKKKAEWRKVGDFPHIRRQSRKKGSDEEQKR